MKNVMGFVLFAAGVVGLLLLFPGRDYPRIPRTTVHQSVLDNAGCLECHGEGKSFALKQKHPPKYECLKCHQREG